MVESSTTRFFNIFRIPELRNKIFFTLLMIAIYRIGIFIPVPGVNMKSLEALMGQGTLLNMFDLFAGGGLRSFSIFAMGVIPYINASIIMQLLTVVIPALERLAKEEGEIGRRKITQYTRYLTVVLAFVEAFGMSTWLRNLGVLEGIGLFYLLNVSITLTAGSLFLMWIGEIITEYGAGNGVSLIIFSGIIARIPSAVFQSGRLISVGQMNPFFLIFFLIVGVGVFVAVIYMQEAQRKIPIQYARRVVGRRVYGGQSSYLPLRVNQGGVLPIIFASSVLLFPSTLAQFLPNIKRFADIFSPGSLLYISLYALLIIFFTYFYSSIVFNPDEIADNIKKYGGFIPGIRPGRYTSEYINEINTRINFIGAIFLAILAVAPSFIRSSQIGAFTSVFFGTGVLIVVGVAVETVRQLESQLIMRHYEGFLK
ncbi:MAG: preprotein translocase subunit SecY [bacterium]|nr:preprotein translocase subunit SecY [bacterium]